jgi:hypothetical protein
MGNEIGGKNADTKSSRTSLNVRFFFLSFPNPFVLFSQIADSEKFVRCLRDEQSKKPSGPTSIPRPAQAPRAMDPDDDDESLNFSQVTDPSDAGDSRAHAFSSSSNAAAAAASAPKPVARRQSSLEEFDVSSLDDDDDDRGARGKPPPKAAAGSAFGAGPSGGSKPFGQPAQQSSSVPLRNLRASTIPDDDDVSTLQKICLSVRRRF